MALDGLGAEALTQQRVPQAKHVCHVYLLQCQAAEERRPWGSKVHITMTTMQRWEAASWVSIRVSHLSTLKVPSGCHQLQRTHNVSHVVSHVETPTALCSKLVPHSVLPNASRPGLNVST